MHRSVPARIVAAAAIMLGTTTVTATAAHAATGNDLVVSGLGTPTNQTSPVGSCTAPNYATIQAAVTAASALDTVHVCTGTYPEAVTIDKVLQLVGPTSGPSAVVAAPSPGNDLTYTAGGTSGTVDRLHLAGSGVHISTATGIAATGYTWTHLGFSSGTDGIRFHANGTTPTTISADTFSGDSGTGVAFVGGPANDVTIEDNTFGSGATAVDTAGDGSTLSTGLHIVDNSSDQANKFVHLVNTGGALIENNSLIDSGDTVFDIDGDNNRATIKHNVVDFDGDGPDSSLVDAVAIGSSGAGPNTALTITANQFLNRERGIRIRPGSASTPSLTGASVISGNTVSAHTYGIMIEAGAAVGAHLDGNDATNGDGIDCADATAGGGTAGTANTWTDDEGDTSNPAGLCVSRIAHATAYAGAGRISGRTEIVTAVFTRSDGTPAVGAPVTFTITGANAGQGTSTTDQTGRASYSYRAAHAGSFRLTATATTPVGQQVSGHDDSGYIAPRPETTTLYLASRTKGHITAVAVVKPVVRPGVTVAFYRVNQVNARVYLARATTSRSSVATVTTGGWHSGSRYRLQARIIGDSDLAENYSEQNTQWVR